MAAERWANLLAGLAEPFPADTVQWRPGSTTRDKKKAQALAFVDPREYERRLDEVCLQHGLTWDVEFRPWGDTRLICTLTIGIIQDGKAIFSTRRESTGEFDDSDRVAQGTAAEAQAFKRACSKFGLGRYLYDLPLVWVDYDSDRRRLLESPKLPAKFLPSAKPKEPAPPKSVPKPPEQQAPIGVERSRAMAKQMAGLSDMFSNNAKRVAWINHEAVVDHHINKLEELTEEEAANVWHAAKIAAEKDTLEIDLWVAEMKRLGVEVPELFVRNYMGITEPLAELTDEQKVEALQKAADKR